MGSAASKATRKLPTKTQPAWAGARTAQPLPEQFRTAQKSEVHASETKDSRTPVSFVLLVAYNNNCVIFIILEIESDSKDPHFMTKLSQLGQVHVPNPQLGDRVRPVSAPFTLQLA